MTSLVYRHIWPEIVTDVLAFEYKFMHLLYRGGMLLLKLTHILYLHRLVDGVPLLFLLAIALLGRLAK